MTGKKLTLAFLVVLTICGIYTANAQSAKKRTKNRYRVDVIVPLYLDELVKGGSATYKDKMPEKAQYGIGFYAGVSLAADSLKNAGFNVDIYVHDAASPKSSTENLIAGTLDSSDLIIGSVADKDVSLISDLSKRKNINFISTGSAAFNDNYGNPYLTFLQPSLKTFCGTIADSIATRFPGEKVTVLYRTKSAEDDAAYDYITDGLLDYKVPLQYMSCNSPPGKENFKFFVDENKRNIIVVPIQDTGFVRGVLHELSRDFPHVRFEVFGMPSWRNFLPHQLEHLSSSLYINYPSERSLNLSSPQNQYVKRTYEVVYTGKMSKSVYLGYGIMFRYANMLRKHGTGFTDSDSENKSTYNIQPQKDKAGNVHYNENKNVHLVRFHMPPQS